MLQTDIEFHLLLEAEARGVVDEPLAQKCEYQLQLCSANHAPIQLYCDSGRLISLLTCPTAISANGVSRSVVNTLWNHFIGKLLA